jgi:hypothetical protein
VKLFSLQQWHNLYLRGYAGDLHVTFVDEQIDLAAHAEFGQVDTWFDGATGGGEQLTLVLRLKIIQVGPVPVLEGADVVPGAMHKELSIAGVGNDLAYNIIDFASLHCLA